MTPQETIKNLKKLKSYHNGSYGTAIDMAIKALEQQPSEDCISREDILNAIETWDKFGVNAEQKLIRWQDHYVPYVHLDDVRNAIANMPSVTPKAGWIPCSERLPEKRKYYLITVKIDGMNGCKPYYKIQTSWYSDGQFVVDYISDGLVARRSVIAWMPLPTPYEAESKIEQTLAYADQDTMMPAT